MLASFSCTPSQPSPQPGEAGDVFRPFGCFSFSPPARAAFHYMMRAAAMFHFAGRDTPRCRYFAMTPPPDYAIFYRQASAACSPARCAPIRQRPQRAGLAEAPLMMIYCRRHHADTADEYAFRLSHFDAEITLMAAGAAARQPRRFSLPPQSRQPT